MSRLWVPPKVDRQLSEMTSAFNADVREMFWFSTPVCVAWNRELAELDPRLRLGQAKESAVAPGLRPGFYHLVMMNPGEPVWYSPLTGPDGEFAEPSAGMLEALRGSDLQNARVAIDRERAQAKAELDAERDRERDEAARHEELGERWAAATRAFVSMDRSTPWAQNAAGARRRGRKAA